MIERANLLAGRYHLLKKINAGGSAFIYRAKDELTGEIVAVKILKPELTQNEEFIERFKKEVQASLKLRHANIIRAYDAGLDNGRYYIVMDLIEGRTLKSLIISSGPLPIKYMVNTIKKVCLALEYAHVKGFVHRDIKPHNIMIDKSGEPFIADFGIAKNLAQTSMTLEDGSVMGSVHYFSPEQAKGEEADHRTDIYSLGILMYEALTGELPYDADTSVAIALKHINEPLPDVRDVNPKIPESLSRIVQKATQKDRNMRYESVFSVYEDLQLCLVEPDGEYIDIALSDETEVSNAQAPPLDDVAESHSSKSVNKVLLSIGIAVGVIAALILVLSLALTQSAQRHIAIPDVREMQVEKAIELLEDKGFEYSMQYVTDHTAKDTVINQTPGAGIERAEGETVMLLVSEGAGADTMLDVTGQTQQKAEEMLAQAGIEVSRVIKETEGDAPIGNVLKQLPLAGEALKEDSTIILYVKASPDEKKVEMVDVTGLKLKDALNILKEDGFSGANFFVEKEWSDRPAGTIIEQQPQEGTEHLVEGSIYMQVSQSDGTNYVLSEDIEIDVAEDQTRVIVALADVVDGIPIYNTVASETLSAGVQEIKLDKVMLIYSGRAEQLDKEMLIFQNEKIVNRENIVLNKED